MVGHGAVLAEAPELEMHQQPLTGRFCYLIISDHLIWLEPCSAPFLWLLPTGVEMIRRGANSSFHYKFPAQVGWGQTGNKIFPTLTSSIRITCAPYSHQWLNILRLPIAVPIEPARFSSLHLSAHPVCLSWPWVPSGRHNGEERVCCPDFLHVGLHINTLF